MFLIKHKIFLKFKLKCEYLKEKGNILKTTFYEKYRQYMHVIKIIVIFCLSYVMKLYINTHKIRKLNQNSFFGSK